jgi:nucleoside-triphosphatase THEP1
MICKVFRNIIEELCHSHKHLMPKLHLNHIDRVIFKYRQAKEKTVIRNTKQYLKACIVSAIYEFPLEELEPIN